MHVRHVVPVALATAVTLASAAAAGPEATKQRVAITSKGKVSPGALGQWVPAPLQSGVLARD